MNFTDLINPYSYAMKLRRLLYQKGILKSERISVPVISIGNLSMGGTGKTPVTLALARYCIEALNKKTAIVLRGYKRKSSGFLIVSNGKEILEDVTKSGDEGQLYAQELPEAIVICDEDRVRGARNAVKLGAEVILLDDGFQHLRLKRDLNILLISALEGIPPVVPFGKGRETASAMNNADFILVTNSYENSTKSWGGSTVYTKMIFSHIDIYSPSGRSSEGMQVLAGKQVLALSGIGHPENFERSLVKFVGTLIPYRLHDHAKYDTLTIEKILLRSKETECDYIVTTTKDAVKLLETYKGILSKLGDSFLNLGVIHAEIEFLNGKEILFNKIDDLFKTHS
jgi:tetraacyldisaccharide 4'-kinase